MVRPTEPPIQLKALTKPKTTPMTILPEIERIERAPRQPWKTNGIFYPMRCVSAIGRLSFVARFYRSHWAGTRVRLLESNEGRERGFRIYWAGGNGKNEGDGKNMAPRARSGKVGERADTAKQWRKRKLRAGLCGRCGKRPCRRGMKSCARCQSDDAAKGKARRERMKNARDMAAPGTARD